MVILVSIIEPTPCLGQIGRKKFEPLTVNDGLVQSAVLDITSDQYQFLWIGTNGGLSRYDGSDFASFVHDPEDSTSLSSSSIRSLLHSTKGDLWIGTANGLNRYDPATEGFIRYEYPNLQARAIRKIHEWSPDTLALETNGGLFFLASKNKSLFQLSKLSKFKHRDAILRRNKQGVLYIHANDTLSMFGSDFGEVIHLAEVQDIHLASNQQLWVKTYSNIQIFNPDLTLYKKIDLEKDVTFGNKFFEDNKGLIYVLNGYLLVFDKEGNLLEEHRYDPKDEYSIPFNALSKLHIGSDGIWWMGTVGYGMSKYDPNKPSIGVIQQRAGYTPSLSNRYVTSIFTKDDQTIYIGTDKGLDVFDREKQVVKSIYPERINFLKSIDGVCYAATSNALVTVDLKTQKVERKLYDRLALRNIKMIEKHSEDSIWVGANSGLFLIDLKTYNFKTFLSSETIKGRTTGDWITSMVRYKDQMLIGTSVGMYEMDLKTKVVSRDLSKSFPLLKDAQIKCMETDSRGIIWIGTAGNGVFGLDLTNKTFQKYNRKDGLFNEVIYGILEDKSGYLWMSSNNGLFRFSDIEKKFVNLDVNYGLQSNEFNTSAYFKSESGVFYFGGVMGLNYFHPGFIENSRRSETHITNLYINNLKTTPSDLGFAAISVMDLDTIILAYDQNIVGFDFKSSNFTIAKLNQYAYYLENLENDWNYVNNRRYASYSSLNPGTYVFKVKSANNNGLWAEDHAQMVIIIEAPYWQKWWFKTLLLFILIALISILLGNRIARLKRSKVKLEGIVAERTSRLAKANTELITTIKEKELAQQRLIQSEKMAALGTMSSGMGHEINNPLNIISQSLQGLERELDQAKLDNPSVFFDYINFMNNAVERATAIIKSLSNLSRSTPSFDDDCDIHSIIDDCILLLQNKMQEKVTVLKSFQKEDAILKGNSGKLHQIFFNLISNAEQAIEKSGEITISTYRHANEQVILVSDTGSGITIENQRKIFDPFFTTKEQGKGTGLGLSICHDIVKEHKGTIEVKSVQDKGTEFRISLPLNL
ncbi:MAG: ATP-binding protein [Ekhidna sp.]